MERFDNTRKYDTILQPGYLQIVYSFLIDSHNCWPLQLLLCFEVLERVLLFTASDEMFVSSFPTSTVPYQSIGAKLAQTLIVNHLRVFYSSLVTTNLMRVVAACLRVLVAMVMQGMESCRELQRVFNFGYKPLEVFPHRTNLLQASDVN